ncbi:hypothetical protein ACFLSH_02850 [Bacteroidota bacterium]
MGFLDFKWDKYHLRRITSSLKRRGLTPEVDGDAWQIHGPHQGMNYQCYEGWAYFEDSPDDYVYVHIMPRAVYEVDPDDKNIQYTQENRITIV